MPVHQHNNWCFWVMMTRRCADPLIWTWILLNAYIQVMLLSCHSYTMWVGQISFKMVRIKSKHIRYASTVLWLNVYVMYKQNILFSLSLSFSLSPSLFLSVAPIFYAQNIEILPLLWSYDQLKFHLIRSNFDDPLIINGQEKKNISYKYYFSLSC